MPSQIQSIERAAAILRLLTRPARRRGVAELANELQLPKGTVHGILRTLHKVGFVEKDDESGKYQVGPSLLQIGSSYLEASELRLRALGWSETLARQTGASVRIGTLHENLVLIVHQAFSVDGGVEALGIGSLMPLHATALGKALLAYDRSGAGEVLAGGLRSLTPHTLTDPDRLSEELDAIVERGWAGEVAEFLPGAASIAAPIEGREHRVVGAIAITGSLGLICAGRSPRPELASYVVDTASRITRELGGGPW